MIKNCSDNNKESWLKKQKIISGKDKEGEGKKGREVEVGVEAGVVVVEVGIGIIIQKDYLKKMIDVLIVVRKDIGHMNVKPKKEIGKYIFL